MHRGRLPRPAPRRRHRSRWLLRMVALAVPASALLGGVATATVASAAATSAAAVGAAAAAPTGYGYGPASLQSAYKLPSSTTGVGQTVAVISAYNDANAAADLAAYRAAWGQPACVAATGAGCLTVVNQNGATAPLPSAPPYGDDWTSAASAGVDMVSAICPNCRILLVEAQDDYGQGLYFAVNTAVTMGVKFVDAGWGSPESISDNELDATFFNHPGVVITAPASDDGSGSVDYPAASPDVVAVGGTTLTAASNARGWTETAWGEASSGCSGFETRPAWQPSTNCPRRTDNDIAADADPRTGVARYDSADGGWSEVGGTDVASAIIAATYALAGTPAPGTYPASYLYAHPASLFDVTSGSNGTCGKLCTAGTGYDAPTGLGTPDGIAAFAAPYVNGSSTLLAGQTVKAGQDLVSPNGQYTLAVLASGNVVVSGNGCSIWSTGTMGAGNYLTMQSDGNLVLYSSTGTALWYSKTNGTGGADHLSLQNDGNAIVFTSAGANVWAAGRANASRLCAGGILHAGQALYSPSEKYELTMQTDGNLVAYDGTKAIWSSGTLGTGTADYLTMQTDGNLVVYTSAAKAVWNSHTQGTGTVNYLLIQDDGNVVVYTGAGKAVWASGTSGK